MMRQRSVAGLLLFVAAFAAQAREVPDTIAERVRACTACHGEEGRAGPDGYYPRIAGKPAGYLYRQLLAFRDGRRRFAPMASLLAHLTDDYLREMAGYFAALEVAYPAPARNSATAAQRERGRQLVRSGDRAVRLPGCAECHGDALMGDGDAVPGLLGLPRDYLNAQLGAWRGGLRRAAAPDCMATIAQRLAATDVAAVSAWLASQPVPPHRHAAQRKRELPLECGSMR